MLKLKPKAMSRKVLIGLVAMCPIGTLIVPQTANAEAKWTMQEPAVPVGGTNAILRAVSCTSSTACTAVGRVRVKISPEENTSLADAWNGTAWSAKELPHPTGAKLSELVGVSCTSGTTCTAVGWFYNSAIKQTPLVEKLSGTTWTVQEPPVPASGNGKLTAVSCTASTACVAVGTFANSEKINAPFAEILKESTWTLSELSVPTGSKGTILNGVSCKTATACAAVGYFTNSAGHREPVSEKLEGTAWTVQEPPAPTGTSDGELRGVSCSLAATCTAVGFFVTTGSGLPLAESLEGTWTFQEPPVPPKGTGTLHGVSCASATACMGIGVNWGYSKALAENLAGSTWTNQEPPIPAETVELDLPGVSCTSASECLAVGWVYSKAAGQRPLAELYK